MINDHGHSVEMCYSYGISILTIIVRYMAYLSILNSCSYFVVGVPCGDAITNICSECVLVRKFLYHANT